MPFGVENPCVVNIRSKIYVIGGYNDKAVWNNQFDIWSGRVNDVLLTKCIVEVQIILFSFERELKIMFLFNFFQPLDRVMIYDVNDKQWSEVPSLNIKRHQHACMVDRKTETIHVMGGYFLDSTETLDVANKKWILGPKLKVPLMDSAAVSSNSNDYVGYLVGGYTDDFATTSRIWGLQRSRMEWIEMSNNLKIPRFLHSVVNVKSTDIGC